jgi:hypothetical protein
MNIPILTLFSSSSAWKGGEPHLVWILSHHEELFASPNSLLSVNSRLLYISFSFFLCFAGKTKKKKKDCGSVVCFDFFNGYLFFKTTHT